MSTTLYDKIFQAHIVDEIGDDALLYIDRHLIHEVTSPQAFDGLTQKGRKVRRPDLTFATMDHSISTRSLAIDACGPANKLQLQTLLKPYRAMLDLELLWRTTPNKMCSNHLQ